MTDDDLLAARLSTMLAERAEDVASRAVLRSSLGRDVVLRGRSVRRRRRLAVGSAAAAAAVVLGVVVAVRPAVPFSHADPAASANTSTVDVALTPAAGPLRFEPRVTRTNGTLQFDVAPVLDPDWAAGQLVSAQRVTNGWVVQVLRPDGTLDVVMPTMDGTVSMVSFPAGTFRGLAVAPDGSRYVIADRPEDGRRLRVTVTRVNGAVVEETSLPSVDGETHVLLTGWTSKGILLMTEPAGEGGSRQWLLWDPATGTVTKLPSYTTVFAARDDPDRLVVESGGCWRTLELDKADLTAAVTANDPDPGALGPLVQCAGADSRGGAVSVSPEGRYLLGGGLVSALDGSGSVPLQVTGRLGVLGWEDEHTVVVIPLEGTGPTAGDGRTTTYDGDWTGVTPQRCDVRSGACIAVDTRGNTGWLP